MSKVTEKKIKHLKGRSVFPSIIFFLILSTLGAVLVATMVAAVLAYMIESRCIEAIARTASIKNTIEELHEDGKDYDKIMNLIKKDKDCPLAVTVFDENGSLIASYGDVAEPDTTGVFVDDIDIQLYFSDKEYENAKDAKDEIAINLSAIFDQFFQIAMGHSGDVDMATHLNEEIYSFCFWTESDMEDGTRVLAEYEKPVLFNDCVMVLIVGGVSSVLFIILILIYLINTIVNISHQRYLLKLLLKDPITGGNNFLAFSNFTTRELSHHKTSEYAIISISMPKYQNYCTLHGTAEGEKLLAAIDCSLNKCLRRGECLARVANAEYILLLKNTTKSLDESILIDKTKQIMEHLSKMLLAYRTKEGERLEGLKNLKLKAGLYRLPAALDKEAKARRKKKNIDVDQLHIKAGIAMQGLSEEAGLMVYNHDMWEKELWEQTVEDKMEEALRKEEFQVYIQPKYHPSTEELVGGEALVRWISPTEGFIPPGKFIPIFEKTGFVTKLDDYMITHTAKLQSDWLNAGKKIVPISVNVSRAHFAQPDLAEHIRDLVDQYPLPHEFIEIELTESAFFDDKNALLTTVKRLQDYGFEVSMDDFGSGYSSLNSLKDLPLNVLKLDAEFFRGDDFDTRGEIVVSEAISLAKQLNMRIVAEGVEKKEQVDFLASQNCDMIQGYYFAKPMPANEYEDRMSEKED